MIPSLLITVLVVALICGLIAFLVQKAPIIPAEYKAIALWVILVIFVIWIISILLPLSGIGLHR